MKTSTILALLAATSLSAHEAAPDNLAPKAVAPVVVAEPVPVIIEDLFQRQTRKAQLELAQQQRLAQTGAKAKRPEGRGAEAEALSEAAAEATPTPLGDIPALAFQGARRRSGKTLVIRSSETEPKSQAAMEEDLSVMYHILSKAVEEKVGSQSRARKAMGIELAFGSSPSPFQSMYLDGYGALFLLHVNFPLLPAVKPEARKEKQETSSTWEEARQELYGHREENKALIAPAEEYDEEKVNNLKDTVLEALKNAANIRDLKPDDALTVCVFGGASPSTRVHSLSKRGSANPTESHVWVATDGRSRRTSGTIMTVRVKKSEAELFAKEKIDLEEFRKKAKVTTYVGTADTGGVNSVFGFGGNGFGYSFGE